MTEPRIVSLIPSATEIVVALGFQDFLVGRSHECDFPPGIEKLPIVTEPKFVPEGSSLEVQARVSGLLQNALSVYSVQENVLREVKPNLVITQTLCEVCAVSFSDVERAVHRSLGSWTKIVSLQPSSIDDIWNGIRQVATALGDHERGEVLVMQIEGRMRIIINRAKTAAETNRPRVGCIEWLDPLMAAGNWMPELIEMAGGESLFAQAGEDSPWMNWEDFVSADPDVILITPCDFDIHRTLSEMQILTAKPEWESLSAVKNKRVYIMDGHHFFNRPGPRLLESLEILAELIHPEAFVYGHQGTGWIPLNSHY